MKYFLDTEFMEDGKTIGLLSIGLVAENGRELYLINNSVDHEMTNDWVKANVIPRLWDDVGYGVNTYCSRPQIAQYVRDMIGADAKPQFWGYYADYDWVCFCQLFGTMMDLPKGFPMYCRDIKQLCVHLGDPALPKQVGEHHALVDARWNKEAFYFLKDIADRLHPSDYVL